MTPNEMSKAIDRVAKAADIELDKIIEAARQKYVIPFCDKHGCEFSAGMGSWSFHGGRIGYGDGYLGRNDEKAIGKRLYAVLAMEYPLNRMNDCGSLMRDYTPANFKTNYISI